MKTGYKVVRDVNGELHSSHAIEGGSVKYALDVWTEPNEGCGPLAVFDTLRNARFFSRLCIDRSSHRIFESEFVPSRAQRLRLTSVCGTAKQVMPLSETPSGTLLAREVRLIRETKLLAEGLG